MAFIEDLPKVSLHDHLDGGLRPETIIDIATREGIALPAGDPDALADWFLESCTGGDLSEYLKTFELTVSVMQTPEDLRRVAYEFALDLASDGVIYAEVRWAPEQHTRGGLTLRAAVESVQTGFDDAMAELRQAGESLRVGQILCAMRHEDHSLEVAELALQYRDAGVVGFDLAGPEAGFSPERHAEALALLARNHFPVTIHAGEEGELDSVKDAVFHRALRLGHGTRLANDIEVETEHEGTLTVILGSTAQWVLDRGIAIECCPTSNLQTSSSPWGDEIEDHPFDVFYQLGMKVTVNTDNRLMSDTTLSAELALLVDAFDYTIDDLYEFQKNAAMAAFITREERLELVEQLAEGFDAFEASN
ncbi:adenosine deaminase [Leucobacter sp. UCMA 4100]|uniref:adenosine deaminase n=1 Tax=Leucobacter sp. UCMA 4100 TaxID=2810534 RepID=UPI0022EA3709|nr:adenosine deaminase [Leucobacter sp. UCMA 4100]MDA3147438.1 adenosine deaminase [Leucobacter sp. UCMA 4100]